jgi:hypothetical protein
MVCSLHLSVTTFASAGEDDRPYEISIDSIFDQDGDMPTLTTRKMENLTVELSYKQKLTGFHDAHINKPVTITDAKDMTIGSGFERTSDTTLIFTVDSIDENGVASCSVTAQDITYIGNPKYILVKLTAKGFLDDTDYSVSLANARIPDAYFERDSSNNSSSSGGTTIVDDPVPTSDILIESVSVYDQNNKAIDQVTKETPAFNISLIYVDYGLRDYDVEYLADTDISVFLTNAGSFVPAGNNLGTIRTLVSRSDGFARFRVDFKNVTWDGSSNSVAIQVRYNIDDRSFAGSTSATVYQAKAKVEEEEEEDPIVPPPTPYIIVTQYNSGEGSIEAGQIFTLDLTFKNTSKVLGLENIVMTIAPDEDLSIATASNTFYIDSMAADATLQRSLEIEAKPAARVGSHTLNITFSYEYLVEKSKNVTERLAKESKEAIAVSISQIDRFAVDPITEIPAGFIGEAAYLPVTFTNKGKSTTYNISATARGNLEILSPTEHYGNLDPGKNDSLDVTVVPQAPGELYGEVVFTYEDENTNQKEITVPFTMFVEEPYVPPVMPDPGLIDPGLIEEEPTTSVAQIIFLALGAVLMAVPIALYLMKRVKAKGSEDFEDDL